MACARSSRGAGSGPGPPSRTRPAGRDSGQHRRLQEGDGERVARHRSQELGSESDQRDVSGGDHRGEDTALAGMAAGELEAEHGPDGGGHQDEGDQPGPGQVEAECLGGPVQWGNGAPRS